MTKRLNLDNYFHGTAKIRRELLKGFTMAETFQGQTRLDFARQLIQMIEKGGGPGFSPEYRRLLEQLQRELEHFNPVPALPPVPCTAVLELLEQIAEMLSQEEDAINE